MVFPYKVMGALSRKRERGAKQEETPFWTGSRGVEYHPVCLFPVSFSIAQEPATEQIPGQSEQPGIKWSLGESANYGVC